MTQARGPAVSEDDFAYVSRLVRERSAIVLEANKVYLVETRLAPVARSCGVASVSQLVGRLRSQPDGPLHRQVIDAMTTNETSFFRDVAPFEALARSVVPRLLAARAATRCLTVWSAACSSGQEPYSIAMLLRDRFPQLATWNVRIIASDLSADMLGRAAAGSYSQLEVNRGLPSSLLVRFFEREGTSYRICDDIRRMVEFRAINLAQRWPFVPPVDVLFLRNVLIYFDVPTKRDVLLRARELLRPDGYLFLGTAETTLNLDDAFRREPLDRATCYRPTGRGVAT